MKSTYVRQVSLRAEGTNWRIQDSHVLSASSGGKKAGRVWGRQSWRLSSNIFRGYLNLTGLARRCLLELLPGTRKHAKAL